MVAVRPQWRDIALEQLMVDNARHLFLANVFPSGLTLHAWNQNIVFIEPLELFADLVSEL